MRNTDTDQNNVNDVAMFAQPIGRQRFLKGILKIAALGSVTVSAARCGSPAVAANPTAALKGITLQEYRSFQALAEVFLEGIPFEFDAGLAMDRYIYGHPHPIQGKEIVHELLMVPSSRLISVLLDGSFRSMVELNLEERRERLQLWKTSRLKMKRGLYNIMRQTCFFIATSRPELNRFAGYDLNRGIIAYSGGRA